MSLRERRFINCPAREAGRQSPSLPGAITRSPSVGSRRWFWTSGGISLEQTSASPGSAVRIATSFHATKVFINRDFWERGTSGFVHLIFLPEMLFALENFNAFEKTIFSNSSIITSKLQPRAIIFFNSLLSALNPKKLTTLFSRSRFINSSCN